MDFAHEQEQHKALHDFLDKFLEQVKAAQTDASKFDAPSLLEFTQNNKDVMVSFGKRLTCRTALTAHSVLTL